VWVLVSTFFDIALHRRGPEDLPASRFLFTVVVLCYCLVGILSVLVTNPQLAYALGAVSLSALLLFVFIAAVLSFFGKSRRFLQTTTAYAGVDTLLTLLGLPLLLWIAESSAENPPALAVWLYLLLIIWSLEVFSYILSRSLEVTHWMAASMVIAYFLVSYSLNSFIFAPAT